MTLDDYVLDWIPTACAQVREAAGSRELSLLGYCMGGLFALMYLGASRDRSVRNMVTIGAPLDVSKMGLFAWAAKMAGGQVEFLARRIGNVPGGLSSAVFRLLTPAKNVTRYADLFMNMWDREYVNGFDAMNQWVGQFIDYPQGAFLQFVARLHAAQPAGARQDALRRQGRRPAAGARQPARLRRQDRPDRARRRRCARSVDAVGSADVTYRLAPGGHMGVFAGAQRPAPGLAAGRGVAGRPLGRPARRAPAPPPRRARRAARHARAAPHAGAPPTTEGATRCCSSPSTSSPGRRWRPSSPSGSSGTTLQPEGFRFVGEYVWQDREPPFRGIAVIEADDVEALNAFALHYGPTLTMTFHPASDVHVGIASRCGAQAEACDGQPPPARQARRRNAATGTHGGDA